MKRNLHPILEERLRQHKSENPQSSLNAAKEIVQEIALLGLMRGGFFKRAAFHGGTAMRIFYGLNRFSEDLDFCLQQPDRSYKLTQAFASLQEEIESWGLSVEIAARSKAGIPVKKAFMKETSLGAILTLDMPINRGQKLNIKIEVDSNPPDGAIFENRLYDFPTDFYVVCHDLPTMFAGKLHAVLCRKYVKGRDWYDLLFYLTRRSPINYRFLRNALLQTKELGGLDLPKRLELDWVIEALKARIGKLDVARARKDVLAFLPDARSADLWSRDFFTQKVDLYAGQGRSSV